MPIFNKEILKPVNAFMTRITPTKPFWRANWTVRQCRSLCVGFSAKPCHCQAQPCAAALAHGLHRVLWLLRGCSALGCPYVQEAFSAQPQINQGVAEELKQHWCCWLVRTLQGASRG